MFKSFAVRMSAYIPAARLYYSRGELPHLALSLGTFADAAEIEHAQRTAARSRTSVVRLALIVRLGRMAVELCGNLGDAA